MLSPSIKSYIPVEADDAMAFGTSGGGANLTRAPGSVTVAGKAANVALGTCEGAADFSWHTRSVTVDGKDPEHFAGGAVVAGCFGNRGSSVGEVAVRAFLHGGLEIGAGTPLGSGSGPEIKGAEKWMLDHVENLLIVGKQELYRGRLLYKKRTHRFKQQTEKNDFLTQSP